MLKIYNDIGEPWQIGFQEESTPISAGIRDIHNNTFYYLIIVITFVTYLIIVMVYNNRSIQLLRIRNHSTIIEFIWTIIPGVILVLIGIPSLKLLYSIDEILIPSITIKATGFQWAWNYQINDIENLEVNFDSYTKTEDDLLLGELRLLDVDNRLFLPYLTPIRLLVTGQDVIHS